MGKNKVKKHAISLKISKITCIRYIHWLTIVCKTEICILLQQHMSLIHFSLLSFFFRKVGFAVHLCFTILICGSSISKVQEHIHVVWYCSKQSTKALYSTFKCQNLNKQPSPFPNLGSEVKRHTFLNVLSQKAKYCYSTPDLY